MKRRRSECNPLAASPTAPAATSSTSASMVSTRRTALPSPALLLMAVVLMMKGEVGPPVWAFETPSVGFNRHHRTTAPDRGGAPYGSSPRAPRGDRQGGRGATATRLEAFVAADDSRSHRRRRNGGATDPGAPTPSSLELALGEASIDASFVGAAGTSSNALPRELLVPQEASSGGLLLEDGFGVLGAAMLVTSNTIGAGCLVLPELTSGPGLGLSAMAFGASYLVNLVSGLTLAHVAIEQHHENLKKNRPLESGSTDATSTSASSFQELAASTLGESAGTVVSSVSLLVNAAVLSFDVGQVGHLAASAASSTVPWVGPATSAGFAVAVAALLAKCPAPKLSGVASACVALLLGSFAGLLAESMPALLADPAAPFVAAGTSPNVIGSLGEAAPVIFMSMVYQNIVPTIVKMLGYDAKKVTAALALGSLLPLGLYLLWCCAAGGTAGPEPLASNPLLAVFTLTTLMGSAIGTGLSLTEEVQALRTPAAAGSILEGLAVDVQQAPSSGRPPQWTTVAASVGLPLVTALALGEGRIIEALEWAGSFGSPLLYGVLPAAMAFQRRQDQQQHEHVHVPPSPGVPRMEISRPRPPFVYSWQSAGALGLLSAGFIGQELVQQAVAAVSS